MRSGNNASKAKKAPENMLPKVTIKADRLRESIQSTNKPVSDSQQATKRQSVENVKSS